VMAVTRSPLHHPLLVPAVSRLEISLVLRWFLINIYSTVKN
jgi:hypothetical protein